MTHVQPTYYSGKSTKLMMGVDTGIQVYTMDVSKDAAEQS